MYSLALLTIMLSCNMNTGQNPKSKKTDTVAGSTLANIEEAEYSMSQFEIDNKLCFATINQYFKEYKHKVAFPYSLWVTVETSKKNKNGHPTDDEALIFNNLEDSLITTLAEKTPFCYIGRTTRDGYREIMFYVDDEQKATDIMDGFIKTDQFKKKITYEVNLDKEWVSVEGFYEKGN